MSENQKINTILENKRNDVLFMACKILNIMLKNFETRRDKNLVDGNIIYKSKAMNHDLYNQNDLTSNVRYQASYTYKNKKYYYTTVVQLLETLIFGMKNVSIEITTSNASNIHKLSVPYKLMEENYELIKSFVSNFFPIIKAKRIKKNKKVVKTIILNEEIIVPEVRMVDIELEDNSTELPTIL